MALNLKSLLFVSLFIALVAAPIAEATFFPLPPIIFPPIFRTPPPPPPSPPPPPPPTIPTIPTIPPLPTIPTLPPPPPPPPPPTIPTLPALLTQGSVFCTPNGNMLGNGTATPPFPNAQVQLRCGPANLTVFTTTTNSAGVFLNITLLPLNLNLSTCNLVVNTPLSICNSTLPTVSLLSPIQVSANITLGNIINIIFVALVEFQPMV